MMNINKDRYLLYFKRIIYNLGYRWIADYLQCKGIFKLTFLRNSSSRNKIS